MIFLYCNDKDSIRVLSKSSMILERLWKVLGALLCLLIHAWGCWILNTTGIMDHKLLDQLKIALAGCLDWGTLQREDCLCAQECGVCFQVKDSQCHGYGEDHASGTHWSG